MGKMATQVLFLTDDAEPESVWVAGNVAPGERVPGGIEGVDGVIDAPAVPAVPATAASATQGMDCKLLDDNATYCFIIMLSYLK